jgi:hypothetical protein
MYTCGQKILMQKICKFCLTFVPQNTTLNHQ